MSLANKIAVIGVGSGGILSLSHMLVHLRDYEVYSIHDPNIPIVGIGESTNPFFWTSMYLCLGIDQSQVLKSGELNATIKYGSLYKEWNENETFLNDLFGNGESAVHFDTYKIKDFFFNKVREKYRGRFFEITGKVEELYQNKTQAGVVIDGVNHEFDYVIDCRGFPKERESEYVYLNMPNNHCLVHNVEGSFTYDDWGYTLHQATKDGWMFGVPLRTRKSYGYLFNDTITPKDVAKENFSQLIQVPLDQMQDIEFKFKSYYAKKMIDGRIFKNGNNVAFLEPMFSNSLWMYDYFNELFVQRIKLRVPEEVLNFLFVERVTNTHDLICYYYSGGTKQSDFWDYARKYSSEVLSKSVMYWTLEKMFKHMEDSNSKIDMYSISPYSTESMIKIKQFLFESLSERPSNPNC